MIISCYTKRVYYNKKSYKIRSLIQSNTIGMIPKKGSVVDLKNMLAKNCNVRRKENRTKKKEGR